MKQSQINREVARATGESVEFIRKRGFDIIIVPVPRNRPRRGGAQAIANRSKPVDIQQCKAA